MSTTTVARVLEPDVLVMLLLAGRSAERIAEQLGTSTAAVQTAIRSREVTAALAAARAEVRGRLVDDASRLQAKALAVIEQRLDEDPRDVEVALSAARVTATILPRNDSLQVEVSREPDWTPMTVEEHRRRFPEMAARYSGEIVDAELVPTYGEELL